MALTSSTCAAQADTITDWNQTAIEVMKVAGVGGNPWSRTLAMVHVAMSDTINSVQPRYARYVASIPNKPSASTIADLAGWFQATNVSPIVRIHKSFIDASDQLGRNCLATRAVRAALLHQAGFVRSGGIAGLGCAVHSSGEASTASARLAG